MTTLTLEPIHRVEGAVRLPGSKSISNRALLLGALATGTTEISNLLESDDTGYMLDALKTLGITVARDVDDERRVSVVGGGGPLVTGDIEAELMLGMAGTAYRPLAAALTLGRGTFTLTGNARMYERPIAHLVDGLRQLGADITYLGEDGFPPLRVRGTGLRGGETSVPGTVSSQFLTSLLMAAPLAEGPVTVNVPGEQVSKPYLDITMNLMRRFGAEVDHDEHRTFHVRPGGYRSPGHFLVEGDASSATYFLAAGAISGGPVRVYGLGRDSIQGDRAFVDVLRAMGATVDEEAEFVQVRGAELRGIDMDLNAIPDAAMTVAVMALFARGRTRIRNIANWRVKETDRLAAMACELRKLGATVDEGDDSIAIDPPAALRAATIESYGDHRVAMSFSLAALGGVPVTINDPECVSKTFPDFFDEFASISHS